MSTSRRIILSAVLLAAVGLAIALPACAQERILFYSSDITVNTDASMLVRETIKVYSQNSQIVHGIYRDFPTRYKDKYGNNYVVGFQVTKVMRDGSDEPYHSQGQANGERVYVGDANVTVPVGEHTYVIEYKTTRQLGFFQDYDELYWNVTGNGWIFPIEHAEATVTLPSGVPPAKMRVAGWTGRQGSTTKNLQAQIDGSGRAVFRTVAPLSSYEGLTIAVSWPKGVVTPPTRAMELAWLIQDNRGLLICVMGLFAVFCYYMWAQLKVGMDPDRGAIVPQWDPPDNLSPAALRYVGRMGADNEALTAALINAAVKGAIEIKKPRTRYTITRKEGELKSPLSEEEAVAVTSLVGARQDIELERSNHSAISGAVQLFGMSLQAQYGKGYFATHSGYAAVGIVLSILTLIAGFIASPTGADGVPVAFLLIWLSFWTAGTAVLVWRVVASWREARGAASGCSAGCLTLFALPFVLAEVVVLVISVTFAPKPLVLIALAFGGLNVVFFRLLRAYTKAGRAILDKAEGLRMYMKAAEQDRLNILNPPDKTPELYEKLLPYALALDVEHEWSEQFADVLEKAQADGSYHPAWYVGSGFAAGNYAGFASSLGSSLSGAISSSSMAPGSSGGGGGGFSSGGGSSGGGGGGGGGGGW